MNRIILGYEKYDFRNHQGWNFNGRICDQTARKPLIPINNRLSIVNRFYQEIYQLLVDPHKFPDSYKLRPPLFNKNIGKHHLNLCVDFIPKTTRYFYPIFIYNVGFFTEYIDQIEISDRVRNDINDGRAYMIFIYAVEGDLRNCYQKFNDLVKKLCLPKKQIIMFHGDHDSEFFQDAAFTYVPVSVFQYWIREYQTVDNENFKYQPDKLFLNLNRTIRPHKQLMLGSLIRHDLLKYGLYSCGILHDIDRVLSHAGYELNDNQKDILRSLQLTSPDNQVVDNQIINIPSKINFQDYQQTFLSLVNETLDRGIFISKKTFKPMAMQQPFLILAGPGHLKILKNLGYKTFDKFWNEDYDQEQDLVTRIEKISMILKYLSSLSTQQLINMRDMMSDILQHNQKLFSDSIKETSHYIDQVDIRDYLINLQKVTQNV